MIYSEYDFLDKDLFEGMMKKCEYLYKLSKEENHVMITDHKIDHKKGIYEEGRSVQFCKRFRFWCNGQDVYEETIEFFGEEVKQTLDAMYAYFNSQGMPDIKLSNVWFQYGDMDTQMYRHSDGEIHGASFDNCFTSMIFLHPRWPKERGGAFRIEELNHDNSTCNTFNADPNLMLIWNRNHPHWMEPIVKKCPLRMFFGMSWYQYGNDILTRPGDSQRHQNIYLDSWDDPNLKDTKSYNDGTHHRKRYD